MSSEVYHGCVRLALQFWPLLAAAPLLALLGYILAGGRRGPSGDFGEPRRVRVLPDPLSALGPAERALRASPSHSVAAPWGAPATTCPVTPKMGPGALPLAGSAAEDEADGRPAPEPLAPLSALRCDEEREPVPEPRCRPTDGPWGLRSAPAVLTREI